jgi:hypothetical protein
MGMRATTTSGFRLKLGEVDAAAAVQEAQQMAVVQQEFEETLE